MKFEQVADVLKAHCESADLKRLDQPGPTMEAMFIVTLADYQDLAKTRDALQQLDDELSMTFLENSGVFR